MFPPLADMTGLRWKRLPLPKLPSGRVWAAEPTKQALFQRQIDSLLRRLRKSLKALCVWYCEWRKHFSGDSVTFATTLADALVAAKMRLPLPVTSFAVYVVRNGIMDRICKCPGDPS